MMIGKSIALTIQTFVGKVMSLLFNMLSKLVIAFLPRSKHLLIGNNEPEYRKKYWMKEKTKSLGIEMKKETKEKVYRIFG